MLKEFKIDLGEMVTHDETGVVIGSDTGRVIAKFSHEQEARAFCDSANEDFSFAIGLHDYDN